MSVYADMTSGDATQDFYDISWCDGNISQGADVTIVASSGSYTASQVVYGTLTSAAATAARLYELVNTSAGLHWDFPILVLPIDASVDGTNPFTGHDITGNGETYLDVGVTPNVITVAYDISDAGGLGIFVYGSGNNPISFPRGVLLYHELSHAYHLALDNSPFMPGVAACTAAQNASDEPQAETDENVMRSQLNLCQRAVCNHGGGVGHGDFCGGTSRPPCADAPSGGGSSGGSGSSGGCFIVSAATGSAYSPEVKRLQEVRAQIGARSPITGRLINEILREYYRFSPEIARLLEKDAVARRAILAVVVRPLIAWYALVSALGLERGDSDAVSHAAQGLLDACPRLIGESRIAPLLEAIQAGSPTPPNGAPEQLCVFWPRITQIAGLHLASWALLDALVRAWTITSRHADVLSEVADWLATAPLAEILPSNDPNELEVELASLAEFFDFEPRARRELGNRLARAWPSATESLRRHDFIQ